MQTTNTAAANTGPTNGPGTPASRALPASGAGLRTWLVARRNAGATPAEVAAELVAAGWDADAAATTALGSLRSVDRRGLLYATLTTSAGVAALSVASAAHLLIGGNTAPEVSASALTVAAVALPVAAWCLYVARRAEAASEFVIWSPQRRSWFATLAGCTAVVGVVRAITYLYGFFVGVTGAAPAPSGADLAQVVVSLSISLPLFIWALHEWRRSNVVISALGAGTDGRRASADRADRADRAPRTWVG